jgi:hypothetical protein
VVHQHRELVAAQPRHQIGLAREGEEHLRQLLQQFVAGRMAAGVVDDLEAVEVDHDHRVLVAVVARLHQPRQRVLVGHAVDQAGHRIVVGAPSQLLRGRALQRDVAEHHHRTIDLAAGRTDGCGRVVDRQQIASAVAQHRRLHRGDDAAADGAGREVGKRRGAGLVAHRHHLGKRAAAGLGE